MDQAISTPLACKQPVYISHIEAHGGNASSNKGINSAGDISLRLAAFVSGATILASSTSAVIQSGGLTGPDAALVASMAGGVAIGSILLSRVRGTMAAVIVLALVSGEAYGVLSTSERIITRRDATTSVTAGSNSANVAAKERLARAEAVKVDHDNLAIRTVATVGCAIQCRTLLQSQADALDEEVKAARKAVGVAPVVKSSSPLADRVGVSAVTIDLLAAVLLSVGSNLLGAVLIGFAGRPGTRRDPVAANYARSSTIKVEALDLAAAPACPSIPALTDGTRQLSEDHEPVPPIPRGGAPRPVAPVSERTRGLLMLIHANHGTVQGSQRALAEQVGLSKGGLGRALDELVSKGVVDVTATKSAGTVIRLTRAA